MAFDIREHPFFQDGVEEGKIAGKAEGQAEAKAEILIKLLTDRLGDLGPQRTHAIAALTIERLDELTQHVLTLDIPALDDWLRTH